MTAGECMIVARCGPCAQNEARQGHAATAALRADARQAILAGNEATARRIQNEMAANMIDSRYVATVQTERICADAYLR
jgi:hypothetical protein